MNSCRYEDCRFVKFEWSCLGVAISLREKTVHELFSFFSNLLSRWECDKFHWAALSWIVQHFSMYVYIVMIFKLCHNSLGLLKRILERPRISPGEVCRVCQWVKVTKRVRKSHLKATVSIWTPLKISLTALPLHRIWLYSVNRSQSHLVKLCLLGHALDCKSESVTIGDSLDAEVKPCSIMPHICIGQPIATHVARKVFWVQFWLDAAWQIARIKLTRYRDIVFHNKSVLLRVFRSDLNLV